MKKLFLSICITMCAGLLSAQSYHFSQFFSTPLLTNPANTGFTEGLYRFASNMRSQGTNGGSSYFTGYFSADISPLRSHLTTGHKAGLGMYVMNDRALNGAVQTNSVGMSAAYHVGLDAYGEQSFGLGVQGTYNQRRIDYSRHTFENQYGPGGYNPSLPVGEPLDFQSKKFFDLNAGIVYNAALEHKSFFAGVAVYNILQHKDNSLVEDFRMPTRFTFQSGGQLWVGEYGKIYLSLTAMSQAGANEFTVGSAYGHQLTDGDKNELVGGIWYRHQDALIPYLGYQAKTFQVGLSYDYTVSALKTGAQVRNGYELTLLYKAPDNRELKVLIPWY
jgi:type IX secretion system PorP/SprF family membrane protein